MLRHHLGRFGASTLLVVLTAVMCGCPLGGELVLFPDVNLENAVREELGKPFGLLTSFDLVELERLDARGLVEEEKIRDLTGLEYCVFLRWLDLDTNLVSDLTPLEGLSNLEYINLDSNYVTDLQPLSGLLYLRGLSLFDNQVADIGPLVTNAESRLLAPEYPPLDYIIVDADTLGIDYDDGVVTQPELDIDRLVELGVDVILAEGTK